MCSLQVMKKKDLIRKNMVESVNNERNILALANNPFVVRFYYSFTSRENLYIVMEYLNGGDFSRWEALSVAGKLPARRLHNHAAPHPYVSHHAMCLSR